MEQERLTWVAPLFCYAQHNRFAKKSSKEVIGENLQRIPDGISGHTWRRGLVMDGNLGKAVLAEEIADFGLVEVGRGQESVF